MYVGGDSGLAVFTRNSVESSFTFSNGDEGKIYLNARTKLL